MGVSTLYRSGGQSLMASRSHFEDPAMHFEDFQVRFISEYQPASFALTAIEWSLSYSGINRHREDGPRETSRSSTKEIR